MQIQEITDRFYELFAAGLLASIGGAAQSLYAHVRGDKPLSLSLFFINIALAFFVGNVVGGLIPRAFEYRDSMLLMSGFSMYPILNMISTYLEAYLKKNLKSKLNIDIEDKE